MVWRSLKSVIKVGHKSTITAANVNLIEVKCLTKLHEN